MARWFLLINCVSLFGIISGQTWAGNYRWASSCDQSTCCCGLGKLTIKKVSSSVLGVVAGANSLCPVPTIYENLVNVNGYIINQQQSYGNVTWTLSADSKSLTLTSSSWPSQCNDGAVKNTARTFNNFFKDMLTLTTGVIWMKMANF